jgi:hypothetical protein
MPDSVPIPAYADQVTGWTPDAGVSDEAKRRIAGTMGAEQIPAGPTRWGLLREGLNLPVTGAGIATGYASGRLASALGATPQQQEEVGSETERRFQQPLGGLLQPLAEKAEEPAESYLGAPVKAASRLGLGLLSPASALSLAAAGGSGAAGAAMRPMFASQMLAAAPSQASEAYQQAKAGHGPEAVAQGLGAGLSGAFGARLASGEALGAIGGLRRALPSLGPWAAAYDTAFRAGAARSALNKQVIVRTLNNLEVKAAGMSTDDQIALVDAHETGATRGTPEGDSIHALADRLKGQLIQAKAMDPDSGIENYWGRIWPDKSQAADFYRSWAKRNMGAGKGFLKQRVFPTFKEATDPQDIQQISETDPRFDQARAFQMSEDPETGELVKDKDGDWYQNVGGGGLTPPDNVVTMLKSRFLQEARFLRARELFNDLKTNGVLKFVDQGYGAPEGYTFVDDPMYRVITTAEREPVSHMEEPAERKLDVRLVGQYAVPTDVADMMKKDVSEGALEKYKTAGAMLLKPVMYLNNLLNQAELGISGFHATFSGFNALATSIGNAGRLLMAGDLTGGVQKLAASVASPITYALRGREMRADALAGTSNPDVQNAVAGGARFAMDPQFSNHSIQAFRMALAGHNWAAAGLHAVPAFLELAAKPVMEQYVPAIKLGAYTDVVKTESEVYFRKTGQLPTGTALDTIRSGAQDSIDNRFGQVVYDNRHWDRLAKDIAHMTVRSVGWNYGTLAEFGGALRDIGHGQVTNRVAYAASIFAAHALAGAMTQVALTGKPPEAALDYFFPKTGKTNPDGSEARMSLPTYVKDIYAYRQSPSQTMAHKISPVLSTVNELYHNADFYNTEIVGTDDAPYKQGLEILKYIGKKFLPFSFTNIQRARESGKGPMETFGPAFGFLPASRRLTASPADLELSQWRAEHQPAGTRTEAEFKKSQLKSRIEHDMRARSPEAQDELREAVSGGKLVPRDVKSIRRAIMQPANIESFIRTPIEEQAKIITKGDQQDRVKYGRAFIRGLRNARRSGALQGLDEDQISGIKDAAGLVRDAVSQ